MSGIHAVLVINKTDMGEERGGARLPSPVRAGARDQLRAVREKPGAAWTRCSRNCRGKRSLFVGHSGVGKSTLLGMIAPGLELLAGEVNRRTGKGRHTTTAVVLLEPEPGLQLIDTPGVRSFGLWGVDEHALEAFFPEIAPHLGDCRFGDCRHVTEPGCAVRAAMDRGEISVRRWESFTHLREELGEER
ncbi:MAG: ribosome small subunit-dependent GTPase A [Candidatus Eisenbacteria bacterium]|nr:ribosome small subunit-dependent GTPase A [Candidatus Eisenbacteria bacterium]